MSNSKDKPIDPNDPEMKEIMEGLEELKSQVSKITSEFQPVGDMIDFDKMEELTQQLRDNIPPAPNKDKDIPVEGLTENDFGTKMDTTPPPIDGETCMHGNSWHSNCSDCDDLDDYEVVLNEFEHLIKTTPNDKELGKKIRDFYNKWIELNEDNSDNTNNIDI